MKKSIYFMIIILTFNLNGNTNLNNNINPLDNTMTTREPLKIDPTVKYQTDAQERMLDKQLKAQEPPIISSGAKKAALIVTIPFFAGTFGLWRKFTWISSKLFDAKDWTCKKSKDLYKTARYGRKVNISKDEYNQLKKINQKINEIENIIQTIIKQTGIKIEKPKSKTAKDLDEFLKNKNFISKYMYTTLNLPILTYDIFSQNDASYIFPN